MGDALGALTAEACRHLPSPSWDLAGERRRRGAHGRGRHRRLRPGPVGRPGGTADQRRPKPGYGSSAGTDWNASAGIAPLAYHAFADEDGGTRQGGEHGGECLRTGAGCDRRIPGAPQSALNRGSPFETAIGRFSVDAERTGGTNSKALADEYGVPGPGSREAFRHPAGLRVPRVFRGAANLCGRNTGRGCPTPPDGDASHLILLCAGSFTPDVTAERVCRLAGMIDSYRPGPAAGELAFRPAG